MVTFVAVVAGASIFLEGYTRQHGSPGCQVQDYAARESNIGLFLDHDTRTTTLDHFFFLYERTRIVAVCTGVFGATNKKTEMVPPSVRCTFVSCDTVTTSFYL